MFRIMISLLLLTGFVAELPAQFLTAKFGKGLQIMGKDSTFHLKLGFRFQTLFVGEWDIPQDGGGLEDFDANILIRRSRLKFSGFAYSPKITYKLEMALSNRDNSGGASSEFRNAANIILDASIRWNFYKNFSIQFGQRKLPGNRERVISSGDLQLVDRSRLNSRYNIDRDVGLQLLHHFKIGTNFIIKEVVALSQGEGRNVTAGHFGGFNYTFRTEFLPLGKFQSKGDYVGSAIKRESTPKLAIGITYDINKNAVRNRGQLGSFIKDANGTYFGKDLNTLFVDAMFKYRGFSFMGEFAYKRTGDGIPTIMDTENNILSTYFVGTGFNVVAGYMFKSNWEVALRYTQINPEAGVSNDESEYTFGVSKYVVGHKLKVQTDLTYRNTTDSDNKLFWRVQTDIHF